MGKAAKSSRKFAASGKLKQTIQLRKKHQQTRKKIQGRRGAHGKGKKQAVTEEDGSDDDDEKEVKEVPKKAGKDMKKMTVEDLLGAEFMDDDNDIEEDEDGAGGDELSTDEDEEDVADDQSFASVDDLEDQGTTHMLELAQLAEKDPEFYKYLQENDRELLDFNATQEGRDEMDDEDDVMDDDDDDGDDEMGEELPILTTDILKTWQKALLEHRSLRALRKLLIAFRSAVHMNEDDQVLLWRIDNAAVYTKLVTTSLRYTPIVLAHHIPYKTLPNGKFKQPTQSGKQKALQKLTLSYFNNVVHLIPQLTDPETLRLALTESAKILPYVVSSRKAVKTYLKKCLELWSTGEDDIRIAAFLAIRRLASSTEDSIVDLVLKSTYLALVRACKSTSTYRLPSITLMKNSACELFCVDHGATYQHAFGYIRQLAILLRGGMKTKTKEAYKQVYNWQYAHCVDFWALVLGRACDAHAQAERGGQESELRSLIYPLVQVSLGAIKLISNSRSYPFHLHIARSMLHLTRHTRIYVPLTPYLLPIISSTLTASGKPKSSTLRPLDMETHIRAPAQYVKTRVYAAGLVEETVFILAEWLGSSPVHGSVAFPELIVPIVVTLRRTLKNCKELGKEAGMVKGLLERVEDCAKWIDQSRAGINFGPGKMDEVEQWEANVEIEESPLGKYLKVQRKSREKRKRMIDKANKGEDEILED
ncbi:Noc2-domain-containing protein [Suillus clintonianus]|uniref:Noc2-domain-containing protein n=1 Tax=Suillus clintonianus TaxID=1904413 RepID=UPI001B872ABA|nr:Noc2-domain-containing protein [Suillus clintonianus]KAG2123423.1 Noc2-domain-containing protein [Suillus clintonianus]